eukprot:366505-Chlamydomonas_euryale.AAC.12
MNYMVRRQHTGIIELDDEKKELTLSVRVKGVIDKTTKPVGGMKRMEGNIIELDDEQKELTLALKRGRDRPGDKASGWCAGSTTVLVRPAPYEGRKAEEAIEHRKRLCSPIHTPPHPSTPLHTQRLERLSKNPEYLLRLPSDNPPIAPLRTPPPSFTSLHTPPPACSQPPPFKPLRTQGVRDLKQLSGGERSYSTVSFLLAIGEWTETPFRCMDEFDVFMDAINRRVATETLLEFSYEHLNHQNIFLTPQDIQVGSACQRARLEGRPPAAWPPVWLHSWLSNCLSTRPAACLAA